MSQTFAISRRGVVSGAVAALAACGQSTPTSSKPASAGTGPVTLTYAFYASVPEAEIWKKVCADFSRTNGRISVEAYHTNPGGDRFQRMRALLSAGSEPEMMMWTTKEFKGDAIKGTFLELDNFVKQSKTYKKDDIFPLEWNKNVWRGRLLALGLTHSPAVIYYNKDMFAKAGVPEPPHKWDDAGWTWDTLLETSRKLTKVAPNPSYSQFGYDNGDSWWFVQPFIWTNGGDILSDDDS
jgi:multiple sugar transport system substrate-binding protein